MPPTTSVDDVLHSCVALLENTAGNVVRCAAWHDWYVSAAIAAVHRYSADNAPVKGFLRRSLSERASPPTAPRVFSGVILARLAPAERAVSGAIHALSHPREARNNLVHHLDSSIVAINRTRPR